MIDKLLEHSRRTQGTNLMWRISIHFYAVNAHHYDVTAQQLLLSHSELNHLSYSTRSRSRISSSPSSSSNIQPHHPQRTFSSISKPSTLLFSTSRSYMPSKLHISVRAIWSPRGCGIESEESLQFLSFEDRKRGVYGTAILRRVVYKVRGILFFWARLRKQRRASHWGKYRRLLDVEGKVRGLLYGIAFSSKEMCIFFDLSNLKSAFLLFALLNWVFLLEHVNRKCNADDGRGHLVRAKIP